MTLLNIAVYSLIIVTLGFNIRNSFGEPAYYDDLTEEDPYVCNKPACRHIASKIRSHLDSSVDPCDNFYKFACGNYIKEMIIPDDGDVIDGFIEVERLVKTQLKSLFVVPMAPHENKLSEISKTLYQSCIDETNAIRKKYENLQTILDTEQIGWPVLDGKEWNEDNFNWTQSVDVFRKAKRTFNNFLNVTLGLTLVGSKDILLKIPEMQEFQRSLALGFDDLYAPAYLKFMVEIAVILGASRENATAEFMNVVEFEIAFSKIVVSAAEQKIQSLFTTKLITMNSLRENYTGWEIYIEKMLSDNNPLGDNDFINMIFPNHILQLIELINTTPKRVLANYIMWKSFHDEKLEDSKTPLTVFKNFINEITLGKVLLKSRLDSCFKLVSSLISTTALFAKKFIGESTKQEVEKIMTNIQKELKHSIRTNNWIKPVTQLFALTKVNSISGMIGYPNDILNDTFLDKYYEDLNLQSDDYFGNMEKLQLVAKKNMFFKKSKSLLKHIVTGTNAYFIPDNHRILVLGGILQGIFFDEDRPQYLNYGGIGAIIGHEILHSFDTNYWHIIENGKMNNWSDSITETNYLKKAECLINQYNQYFIKEIGEYVNGTLTLDENIADNGGFKMAYLAYKRWSGEHETEKMLPGLEYNPRQLFWINAASQYCSKSRPDYLKTLVIEDQHTVEEFRIIGAFSNYVEFAEDFNCPVGSNMNPENKCVLW